MLNRIISLLMTCDNILFIWGEHEVEEVIQGINRDLITGFPMSDPWNWNKVSRNCGVFFFYFLQAITLSLSLIMCISFCLWRSRLYFSCFSRSVFLLVRYSCFLLSSGMKHSSVLGIFCMLDQGLFLISLCIKDRCWWMKKKMIPCSNSPLNLPVVY